MSANYDFTSNAQKWEKLFVQAIRRVGQQVHPGLTIDEDTLVYVDSLLYQVLSFLCSPPPKKHQDIEERVKSTFPEDLTQWAVREAQEALKKYRASNKKKSTMILCFPVEKVYQKLLKEICGGQKVDYEISVYLNAVLEYVSADVLKLAGNYTDNCKRPIITPKDVNVAISADKVLDQLFKFKSDKPLSKKPTLTKEEVVRDMMSVENKYLRDLEMVVKIFLEAFEVAKDTERIFSDHNILHVFANIREILDFQRELVYLFDDARETNPKRPAVGVIFEEAVLEERFEVYSEYAVNYQNARNELDALCKDPKVLNYLDRKIPELKDGVLYVLPKLLIEPLYQIFHYFELVKLLLKCTETTDPDHSNMRQANMSFLKLEDELKKECHFLIKRTNSFLKHGKNSAVNEGYFKDVQMKIENWEGADLAVQCSELLKEGLVASREGSKGSKIMSTTKDRFIYVFDTLVLICKPRGQPSANCDFHLKERLKTTGLVVKDIPDQDDFKNAFEVLSSEGKKYTFSSRSPIDKNEWLEALNTLAVKPALEKLLDKKLQEAENTDGPLLELDPKLYEFADKDSTSNILFETEDCDVNGPPVIKGGNIYKLVERLTYPTYADTNYLSHFLITYRSFCTPTQLLDHLIKRYEVPEPPNISQEQLLRFRKNYITPVRLRVFNVFRQWVDKHYYDFINEDTLLKRFLEFIKDKMSGDKKMDKAVKSLTRAVRQRREAQENQKTLVFNSEAPDVLVGSVPLTEFDKFDILTLNPIEVARQLTLIESDLYRSIKASELVGQAWNKSEKEDKAGNVLKMIHRFNIVSRWVATSVVETENVKERIEVVLNFIAVLDECMRLNNFNALMEIISGLQSTSVYRLKFTWNEIPAKKKAILEDAVTLMARENNFKKFRSKLHSVNPPCIPFFGMYLSDLTFIEDGNPDFLSSSNTQLINFTKRRRVANVIAEIQLHQNQPYNLKEHPAIQEFLLNPHTVEEEDGYQKSLEIEPRNAEKPQEYPAGRLGKLKRSGSNVSQSSMGKMSKSGSMSELPVESGLQRRASIQSTASLKGKPRTSSNAPIPEDEDVDASFGNSPPPGVPPRQPRPYSVAAESEFPPDLPPRNSTFGLQIGRDLSGGVPPPIPARRRTSDGSPASPMTPMTPTGSAPALPPKTGVPLQMGSPNSGGFAGPNSPSVNSPGLAAKGFPFGNAANKGPPPPLPPKSGSSSPNVRQSSHV